MSCVCSGVSEFSSIRIFPENITLKKCPFDVGPLSVTLAHHQNDIGSTSRVCWVFNIKFNPIHIHIHKRRDISQTLVQCRANAIMSVLSVTHAPTHPFLVEQAAIRIHQPNASLMLGQRRRRWPNIKPTLGQSLVVFSVWGRGWQTSSAPGALSITSTL